MRHYTLALLLAAASLVTACGLKGDLYLPEPPAAKPAPEQAADDSKAPAANSK